MQRAILRCWAKGAVLLRKYWSVSQRYTQPTTLAIQQQQQQQQQQILF